MSDKNKKKISFRLNEYLYKFICTWAAERNMETSEAVRLFCQNYYMDYMKSELRKKPLMPIDTKREKFLDFINTIGATEMKRVLRNPEICATMNGMMKNGGNKSGKTKGNTGTKVKA